MTGSLDPAGGDHFAAASAHLTAMDRGRSRTSCARGIYPSMDIRNAENAGAVFGHALAALVHPPTSQKKSRR
jgi:hypothetical protein